MRIMRIMGVAFSAAVAAGLLASCTPTGGTVSVDPNNGVLTFTADPGHANVVTIFEDFGTIRVTDTGGDLVAGNGCASEDQNTAVCTGVTAITVVLGDGNDRVTNSTNLSSTLNGGKGDDVLEGGAGALDLLTGEEGADTLDGGAGSDVLFEGITTSAVDAVDADMFIGGPGTDAASYVGGTQGVTVDIDGVADDGRSGEGDNVNVDVEQVVGTTAGHTLTGSARGNLPNGTAGDDTLNGLGGTDSLFDQDGIDMINGGSAADTLRCGAGFDTLDGGTETDDCDVEADGGVEVNCEI